MPGGLKRFEPANTLSIRKRPSNISVRVYELLWSPGSSPYDCHCFCGTQMRVGEPRCTPTHAKRGVLAFKCFWYRERTRDQRTLSPRTGCKRKAPVGISSNIIQNHSSRNREPTQNIALEVDEAQILPVAISAAPLSVSSSDSPSEYNSCNFQDLRPDLVETDHSNDMKYYSLMEGIEQNKSRGAYFLRSMYRAHSLELLIWETSRC